MFTKPYLAILLLNIIASCAVHQGNVNNAQLPDSAESIIYEDKVYGYASCHYVLAIGGLGSQGLAAEALYNLRNGVQLEKGEYLDNFTIDHRWFYFVPFFIKHEVLVSADKIKVKNGHDVTYSDAYNEHIESFDPNSNNNFSPNDKVFVQKRKELRQQSEGTILAVNKYNAKVLFNNYGSLKVKRIRYEDIYRKHADGNVNFFLAAEHGDTLLLRMEDFERTSYAHCIFLGSGNGKVVVRNINGSKSYTEPVRNVVIEDSTAQKRSELDSIMAHVMNSTRSPQRVKKWMKGEQVVQGTLLRIEGDEVIVQKESGEEVKWELSKVYTEKNWLEFGLKQSSKGMLLNNQKVTYIPGRQGKAEYAEIKGFRYHNVLIRLESGGMREVPVGYLFRP
ncbi:MAG: DUF6567 family protein [Bacteroidota bacterium]